jgi:hypothetical protein
VRIEIEATFGVKINSSNKNSIQHISIAPNILEKMANDPATKAHYMDLIQEHSDSISYGEAYLGARGIELTGTGIVINADGSATYWCSGKEAEEPWTGVDLDEETKEGEKPFLGVIEKSEYESVWNAEKSAELAKEARERFARVGKNAGENWEEAVKNTEKQLKGKSSATQITSSRFDGSF